MSAQRHLLEKLAARRKEAGLEQAPAQVLGGTAALSQIENPYGTTTMQGRAFELLRKGLRPIEVARALECSPSLISQYMEEEEFKEGVRSGLVLRNLAKAERDEKIDALEDVALQRLGEVLCFVSKPMELLNAVKVLNGLQRRSSQDGGVSSSQESDTVVLQLPKSVKTIQVNMQFNTDNEVVSVDGRELRTMAPTTLVGAIEARKVERLAGRVEVQNESGNAIAF